MSMLHTCVDLFDLIINAAWAVSYRRLVALFSGMITIVRITNSFSFYFRFDVFLAIRTEDE